ncbi:hypothetical protein ACIS_00797 [Anaplasma centrale str. Israel]|uniref:Glutamine amidotransferase n=1 Tax=Anaplasma centrale (strain Israel) TaxID=574556 RepID=D1AS87_ANACI|nr:gamma-glutamyl-gamma-aminobutyrate hydrolase family protein [Anaplasma centrale]ACZ49340.1 hypothetical protein ACIS_00797 [Anaplasma centrale str. Israel]
MFRYGCLVTKFVKVAFCALLCSLALSPMAPLLAGEGGAPESKNGVVVGFLQTEKETYPEELTFSHSIADMLTRMGARVVRVDYNKIVDLANLRRKASLHQAAGDMTTARKLDAADIKREVLDFLRKEGISRIFIPGNFYNLDAEPYPPTPNRQLVTSAIAEIVREDPNMRLMGVCGGLQGIAHAMGIKVVRVWHLTHRDAAASHTVSGDDPHSSSAALHKLRIVPGSRLASIVSKHALQDRDGWLSLYFPDLHGGVVSNDPENIKKLESLGYKVVAYSNDGMIEALEDMHGNILFQDHPEALAIGILNGSLVPPTGGHGEKGNEVHAYEDERYRAALSAMLIMEDFLHR